MSDERVSGPSPLPLHKGGEYDVQAMWSLSRLIPLPHLSGGFGRGPFRFFPLREGLGRGSFRLYHFFGNMNFFFHLRGWVALGKFISMGCAVYGEDIHTAMLSIHLEAEPKVGCILSEPRV